MEGLSYYCRKVLRRLNSNSYSLMSESNMKPGRSFQRFPQESVAFIECENGIIVELSSEKDLELLIDTPSPYGGTDVFVTSESVLLVWTDKPAKMEELIRYFYKIA